MDNYPKYLRLFLISVVSLFVYSTILNSETIKEIQQELDHDNLSDGFEFFLFTGILKYFFLTLGVLSIIFLVYTFLKDRKNAY